MFLMSLSYGSGAGVFPASISAIMILASVCLFARSFFRQSEGERMTGPELRRMVVAIVLTIGYIALIAQIGFFTSSVLFIPLTAYTLGLRRHVLIWVTTAVYLSFIYILFVQLFYTPLPRELFSRFL